MTPDGFRDSTIVLLVLNEIDGLRETFDQIPIDRFARTVAVDGGSTDGTRAFLTERGIPILDQSIPGRGVAFRVALEATDTARLVFYSPDGNEDPADIIRLDDLVRDGADLAIASRFASGAINEEQDWARPRARVRGSPGRLGLPPDRKREISARGGFPSPWAPGTPGPRSAAGSPEARVAPSLSGRDFPIRPQGGRRGARSTRREQLYNQGPVWRRVSP